MTNKKYPDSACKKCPLKVECPSFQLLGGCDKYSCILDSYSNTDVFKEFGLNISTEMAVRAVGGGLNMN